MIASLLARQEWALARALRQAAPGHAALWWAGLVLRGTLPAAIAVTSGWLIATVTEGRALTAPLVAMALSLIHI